MTAAAKKIAANKYDVKIISAALKDSHASSVVIVNFRQ